MPPPSANGNGRIANAMKRSEVYKKIKKEKAKNKLEKRMELRKVEKKGGKEGEELKKVS